MVLSALGAVGSAAGGLMSGIGSLFGRGTSARSNVAHQMNLMAYQDKLQRGLMSYQNNLQQQYDRNRYQNSVYSLRQAGLNPILAASNGVSAGSGSQGLGSVGLGSASPTPSADFSQLGEQISNLAMNTAMIKKTNAEAQNIAQNTALQGAQTSLTIKQLDTEVARLGNILEDTKLKFDQRVQIKAQIMNLKQERNNLIQMENQIKATTSNIQTDTYSKKLQAFGNYLDNKLKIGQGEIQRQEIHFMNKHPLAYTMGKSAGVIPFAGAAGYAGAYAYDRYTEHKYDKDIQKRKKRFGFR